MVLSTGESSGIVTSPNYPHNYPVNVTCHYYIDGLVDKKNLEKVKLLFDDFNLPTVRDRSISIISYSLSSFVVTLVYLLITPMKYAIVNMTTC